MFCVSRYEIYVQIHVRTCILCPDKYQDMFLCLDTYLDTCQDIMCTLIRIWTQHVQIYVWIRVRITFCIWIYPRNALIRIQIYIWKHIRTSDTYLDISRILIWLPRHVSGHVSGHLTSVWHPLGSSWIARLNQTLNDITHIRILNFAVLSYELGRGTYFCGLETLRDFC